MVKLKLLFLFLSALLFGKSAGIIYHLNDSFYETLPAMFGLDEYAPCLLAPRGTYCVARWQLSAEPDHQLLRVLVEYSEHTVKHYNHTYIERGVCLTKSCREFIADRNLDDEQVQSEVLATCINETIHREYGLNAVLTTKYYCEQQQEEAEYDTSDWVVAAIFAGVVLINIIGTLYHATLYYMGKEKELVNGRSLLLCFSVYRNWESLVAPSSTDPKIARLKGFHGIKSVAMFMIILPHVLWLVMSFVDNPHDFEKYYEVTFYQLLFNGLVIVQTFFVISGFLLVYNLEVYAEHRAVNWLLFFKVMFLRWWRLTPANGLMIAFTATWLRHAGSGPLWRYFISDAVVRDCRTYWWSHLFYFNNYIPDDMYCAIQTWYVAVDTQLFTLGLLMYVATKGRRGARTAALVALLVVGMLAPALHIWLQDLDGAVLLTPQFQRSFDGDETFRYIHKPGHNNLPCHVIGMAAGYLVYHWRSTGFSFANNKLVVRLTWAIIPAITAVFYSGHVFYGDGARASLALRIAYGATHRVALGLIVAFGIVGLVMKFDVALRRIFEWRGWVVPSRLSYCVYLVHANVIHSLVAARTTLSHVSTYNIFFFHFGVVMTSFLLAWPFYLLVESPCNKFMKAVFNTDQYRRKEDQSNVP